MGFECRCLSLRTVLLAEVIVIVVVIFTLLQWSWSYSGPISIKEDSSDTIFNVSNTKYVVTTRNVATTKPQNLSVVASKCTTLPRKEMLDWKDKHCKNLLENTYHDEIPVCDQIKCHGNAYSQIVRCAYENLSLRPELDIVHNGDAWRQPKEKSINLIESPTVDCKLSAIEKLKKKVYQADFELKLTQHLLSSERIPASNCDTWINKTTFFHVSEAYHIYFRFLDLYNIFSNIHSYELSEGNYHVIRIGPFDNRYRYPDFDRALFPGTLITLNDLPKNSTVCFKKVVFVPLCYQSTPFRCKMSQSLRNLCFKCNGRGLSGSSLQLFRGRVLQACNISENDYCDKSPHLTVVSRKPYERWKTDNPKKFQRVLQNEDEMVATIRETFPHVVVRVLHMEHLDVCEQIRSAVEADVMLGVHGAGLVHFWWLREEATGFELEPTFQVGNPSFRMLTTIAGRKYVSLRIRGSSTSVVANVRDVINQLKKIL